MDKLHFEEMTDNLNRLELNGALRNCTLYLFGHCNATEELAKLLQERGHKVCGILDNNVSKWGMVYRGISVLNPESIKAVDGAATLVCIVARAYAAMAKQLRQLGYSGRIEKLVDYNSYAEYSLSKEVISRKKQRLESGIQKLLEARKRYPGCFRMYCPFSALGDVYYTMAYLPHFLEKRRISEFVVFVVGQACADVVRLFGVKKVEVLSQQEMDEQIQAVLFTRDKEAYISHQDRPYVVNLYKALYVKKISLEDMYKYGVLALKEDCVPMRPVKLESAPSLEQIQEGRTVILSPYAKSVTNIPMEYWEKIIQSYSSKGYELYTNVTAQEEALPETRRLEVSLAQIQSVVERAGMFIGLRSGLCDVIRNAKCRKIALYPDCYYSDTQWKMEEIYHLEGWENIVITSQKDV